ncbi:hypothetical protein SAY87_001543 [Trapa incisa]|uniref:Pentatricopeptide repeat-containing protein n=1 Tax=Trapa incisa TaxID=236973 RepID=A0AAN7JHH5_9MYRT|nr:hypothetical protein SAY87_001543 [Trapa incisa]
MAVKLLPLVFPKKARHCVNLLARLSSVPCAVDFGILQETHQGSSSGSGYESNVKSLRNNLVPDNLIWVLRSTPDIETSVRIFRWAALQKIFQHTAGTYCVMALKLGLAGNVREMEVLCQNMIKDECPGAEDALVSLVETFVEHRRVNAAIRVLASMIAGNFRPSIVLFNAILGSLVAEKGDLKDVLFVYKEMVKACRVPTVDTLNYLLEALFEAGWVDSALDQYRRMNKKGCHPNSRTFEVVIGNLIMMDCANEAVLILKDMLELGVQMDSRFYTLVVPHFCKENNLAEGMRLFESMKAAKFVPDITIYATLIHHLCSKFLVVEANRLLQEMINNGVMPSDDILEDMVIGLCRLGKISQAIDLLEDKKVLATSPHNALISGCCNAGEFFLAKQLLEKMCESAIADCGSWNILVRWLSQHCNLKQALQVLGNMIVTSLVPDSSTVSALVIGYCKLGKYDDATKLFDRFYANLFVLDSLSYSELIRGLCEVEKYSKATEIFCCMSMRKHSLESSSFNMLIKGVFDEGGIHEAKEILSLAADCGVHYNDETYSVLLNCLSETPKYQLVLLAQIVINGFDISSDAYAILIRGIFHTSDQVNEAALLFNLMVAERAIPESECLLDLLSLFACRSQLHMISSSINMLLYDLVLNSDMYSLLINGLWKEGYVCKARELLDLMLERGWIPDATTHGLFIGPTSIQETDCRNLQIDNISSILAEGLERI